MSFKVSVEGSCKGLFSVQDFSLKALEKNNTICLEFQNKNQALWRWEGVNDDRLHLDGKNEKEPRTDVKKFKQE